MTLRAATHPRIRLCTTALCSTTVGAGTVLFALAACAGVPEAWTPGDLTPEQRDRCRAVAEAYYTGAPEYPKLRDELRNDRVALQWFVRYLEDAAIKLREGHSELIGEERVRIDQIRLRRDDPVPWDLPGQRPDSRAIAQIAAIGEPAVEVVVNDLLRHPQGFVRTIGVEAIAGIGEAAVPAVVALSHSSEVIHQRTAARALGAIGANGPALERLRELAKSGDWRVRSDVVQALRSGGDGARDLLMTMLADDDAFVRRKAAESLGAYRERAAADALIAFLERCKRESDWNGELAAQQALQQMAGTRAPRTAAAWRRFAAELPR